MPDSVGRLDIRCVEHLCRHLHCTKRELTQLCEQPERWYRQTEIEVKGKRRPIALPLGRFYDILKNLQLLLSRIALPEYLHGGVKRHSPKTNALPHVRKVAVLKFDLQDFFPRIRPGQVYRLFHLRLGCSPDVARILTRMVTFNGGLPQGSPTSTTVANLLIVPLAQRLNALAAEHASDYTQFVDDGTVSGPWYLENLRSLIERIIGQEGFRASPKPHKRITLYRHQEQVVTGVEVNRRLDVTADRIAEVTHAIQVLEALRLSGQIPDEKAIMTLFGKIQYIESLNPAKARRLRDRLGGILN
jgi:RNA-directed DNA polymerase